MNSNLKLQIFLKAVDQATRPFKSVQRASKSLAENVGNTQKALRVLNSQAARIDGLRKSSGQLAVVTQQLKAAQEKARELTVAFKQAQQPTQAQANAMQRACKAAGELKTKYAGLRQSVQHQRDALNQAGINTRQLATSQRQLKARISETTAQLDNQRRALERLNAKQKHINTIKQRYQQGITVAGGARYGCGRRGTIAIRRSSGEKTTYRRLRLCPKECRTPGGAWHRKKIGRDAAVT